MNQASALARRCGKEVLRDPLNLFFCLLFPLVLLVMFALFDIPAAVYRVENFAPGIVIFAYSFSSMSGGLLLAADRESALFSRLSAAPLRARALLWGYTAPLLLLCLGQSLLFYAAAAALGLPLGWNILWAILLSLPTALLYIAFGLLLGVAMNQKQIGGLFSMFVTLSTWLSGMWFELSQIGGWLDLLGHIFPFHYAVDLGRAALNNDYVNLWTDLAVLLLYAAALFALAMWLMERRRKGK